MWREKKKKAPLSKHDVAAPVTNYSPTKGFMQKKKKKKRKQNIHFKPSLWGVPEVLYF